MTPRGSNGPGGGRWVGCRAVVAQLVLAPVHSKDAKNRRKEASDGLVMVVASITIGRERREDNRCHRHIIFEACLESISILYE